uniref:hypothetical protein n=1 Tax=Gelidibacter sp. TaxID=2018083 RepID=UPI00404995E6
MYRKEKAQKLVKEFNYLVGEAYYPLGKKGREFKITEIKSELPELKIDWAIRQVNSDNPYFIDEKERAHSEGNNWKVYLYAEDKTDKLKVELEDGLSKLRIRHDIDKLFNQ